MVWILPMCGLVVAGMWWEHGNPIGCINSGSKTQTAAPQRAFQQLVLECCQSHIGMIGRYPKYKTIKPFKSCLKLLMARPHLCIQVHCGITATTLLHAPPSSPVYSHNNNKPLQLCYRNFVIAWNLPQLNLLHHTPQGAPCAPYMCLKTLSVPCKDHPCSG